MSDTTTPLRRYGVGLVLLAAAGTFAVTMGVRQSMGLFLNTMNTATGLGLASISLAFAFGQLWWGLTQPFAGMVADRIGTARVVVTGVFRNRPIDWRTPIVTAKVPAAASKTRPTP